MPDALQLCPNDQAPFFDVCWGHAEALGLLGFRVRTVFFEARRRYPPSPDIDYATPGELPGLLRGERPELVVSHRHSAYRVGVRLVRRLGIPSHVAIAHEFGMFARRTRRLRRRLAGRNHALFAAASAPVADRSPCLRHRFTPGTTQCHRRACLAGNDPGTSASAGEPGCSRVGVRDRRRRAAASEEGSSPSAWRLRKVSARECSSLAGVRRGRRLAPAS